MTFQDDYSYEYEYNFERFYGAYILDLRKEYEISQKELAQILHISNSTLSKMESGQQNMDLEIFNFAIQYFEMYDRHYRFNKEISKLKEAEEWVNRCVREFIDLTYENKLYEFKRYLQNENNKHSFAYFHYKLVYSFYHLFLGKGSMKEVQHLIDSQYFINDYYLAILHDLWGIIEDTSDPNMIRKQIRALQKASSLAQHICRKDLSGLIEYHLIYRYRDIGQFLDALDLINQCLENLQQAGAYRRILTVQMNEGILYRNLNLYSKAIKVYQNIVNNYSQIKDPIIQKEIFDNLAWCEFMQQNDEEAIAFALKGLSMGSLFPDLYIILAFSNYRLKNYEQAKRFAKEFIHKKKIEDPQKRSYFIKLFMKLLLSILESEPDITNLSSQILSMLPQYHAVELEIPLYCLLIDHYQKQNDFQAVIQYQNLLIQYLLHNFIH